MPSDVLLVLSNFPGVDEARRVARTLVEEHLVACANLLPQGESIYRWQGAVETANETLVLFKTTAECYARVESRIKDLHSYELPEIIAVPLQSGLPAYLRWVGESCV
ncbi:MAG: divalent-cation tolerance protein CutA [Pseudomonadota bacterium]|nr:divalent-cation tolerance protein CutA [Pseudomonadota bacterium]